MKILYLLAVCFLATLSVPLFAQCPPPGFPQPGGSCPTAPILCENLDGYCATINNNNIVQNFPGCGGMFVLNNDEWFAFFAGTTSITIQVTPNNCTPGAQQGLQGGIYAGCGPPWTVMDVQCQCTENPFILSSSNFVVGQIYWFVLDGCSGNVCDYSIQVLDGSTVGVPPANPGPITGPTEVCQGTTTSFSLPPVTGATIYNWTLTPNIGTVNANGPNANVTWGNTTTGATLCVTTANGCYVNSTPSCITIDVVPKPTATISGSGLLCAGGGGSVNLTVTFTGEGPWTFTPFINGSPQTPITTSNNPYTLQATQPGTYTIQNLTGGAANCTGTVSGTSQVTQVTLNPTATVTNAQCGQSNGSINVTPAGGTAPYTYTWSSGQTSEDISGVPAGSYTVTVTDANGCTKILTATVGDNTVNLTVTGVVTANTTCNGGNGLIDVSVNPPPGTYTYAWSNGATTQDIGNLPPGSYTITVTSGVTCTGTATFTVADNPNTPNISGTATQSTCELSNGSINITVTGGVSPYTYNWSGGQTTEDIGNVPAGSYTVTVTGGNGCTSTATYTVNNNNPPISMTATVIANTTCNGGNGSITLNVTPANPSYTYTWSNGATTPNLSNLTPGSYTVTVSAGGACTQSATFNIADNPNTPNINGAPVQSTCELNNGSLNITVTGGVSPYTYSWSGGQTTEDLSNIPAGSYTLTVTGANGCSSTASFTVGNNNPPISVNGTVIANTTCNGGNGSITLSVTPANPSYTYVWSTGATTPNLSNLTPGSYTVTVSAGGACTQSATFNVPDNPNTPNINVTPIQSTCDLSNGAINVAVSGGVPPYSFLWSNGATTQNLSNLAAGSYGLTVSGANGCSNSILVTIVNNNPPITVNGFVTPNTLCNGSGNGSISLSVTPPGTYTFAWSNGSTSPTLSNVVQGTYTVTVTGGGSCSQVQSFTIPDNPNGPMITAVETNSTCDLNNGNINISVTGATSPYTYLWSNGATTQDIGSIPAGAYSVTVTGANGCTNIASFSIDNVNPPINITAVVAANTFCIGGNGNINVSVTPNGAYTYLWSTGAVTQDVNNLPGGSYTVTVSSVGTCSETASFDIPDNPNAPTVTLDFTPSTCGLSNGAVNLTASGGVPPYTYLWSSGQTTQDLNNIPTDLYFVTVTGANGCETVVSDVLPDDIITVNVSGTVLPDNSCTTNNGRITLNLNPSPPAVTIQWSNNSTAQILNNLAAGTYSVTVSAGGTCTATATFVVADESQPPNVSYTVTPATCGLANGAIDLAVSGGLTPITYKWSNNATTQDLANLAPGTYTVTVTTAGNCSAVSTVSVPSNDIAINISGAVTDNSSCTAPNGSVVASVSPAGSYNYAWSNSATTASIGNLAPGNYTVTVTTGVTCSATASFSVTDNAVPPNLAAAGTPSTCGLSNGAADANASGGVAPYTFLWSNSGSMEQIGNLNQGVYSVTVTGANGCSSTASVNVVNNDIALNISGIMSENTSCTSGNGALNISVSPAGTYTYNWSNSTATEDLSGLDGGSYTVTVSAGGSCSATATFAVTNNTQDPVISPAITPAICSNSNGGINLSVSNAAAPYTFTWSNSATTEDLANILPGNYSVTVSAANGCTADTTLNVPNNSTTFSIAGLATPLTNCATANGSVDLTITPPAGNYIIQWSNNAATEDIGGLADGTYTVSVTDPAGGGCTATASFIVSDARTYPSVAQAITPEICNLLNGSVDLDVSGGETPYTFLWSNNQTGEDLVNAAAGAYSVTVAGANGCTTTTSATIPGNSISFSLSGTTAPNTVCGSTNGGVDLNVTPAGAYTFAWSNNATTEDLSGIPGGNYSVTVSAGGSCTSVASYTVDDNTLSPSLTGTVTPASCAKSNGAIDLVAGGGVPPYNFLWSNTLNTEDLSVIPAGNYAVTVTGANGCSSTDAFVVPDNVITPAISGVVTPNTSCAAANGGIALDVSPPDTYIFIWSNNQTSLSLVNTAPGDYSVTVSGGGACTALASFTVPDNTETVLVGGMGKDVLCFGGNDGSIDVSVNGGVLPYQFNWSPNQAGNPEDLSGLIAGNYLLTVTDAAGCKGAASFDIQQPASSVQVACSATALVTEPGLTDGAGEINISGGTEPYSVNWSPGGSPANALPGIFKIDKLGVGNYLITVTDANGCTSACNFTVALVNCTTAVGAMENGPLELCGDGCVSADYSAAGQTLDADDLLQFILHEGNGTQIVNEIARNIQPKFCFNPSKMNYGTTYYISAVAGDNDGTGDVVLSDYCTVVSLGTPVIFREKPLANILPPGSLSCAVHQVPLTGVANLPGSTYQWSTLDGSIAGNPAQQTITVVKSGLYTLIVNTQGCADTAATTVLDLTNKPQASISANPSDVLDCTISEIILSGTAEGTTAANTIWILNGAFYSGGNPVPINTPGLYEFVVLDTLTLCSDTAKIVINENLAYPPLFLNPPDLLTCAKQSVTLTGGSPFSGINFAWGIVNGADTTIVGSGTSITVSIPGNYILIGTDPTNTCINYLAGTVNADLTPPVADAGDPFSIACFGETASLDGTGSSGAPNLAFLWTTADGHFVSSASTPQPVINEPGTYLLVVTNPGNGCTNTDEVVIAPESPVPALHVNQPPCFDDKGSIVVDSVIGAKPPVRYSLDSGATFTTKNIFTQLAPGAYTLFLMDANGCSATAVATVEPGDLVEITLEPQVVVKLGDSYQINTSVSVPLSDLTFIQWTPSTGLDCDTCLNPLATPLQSTQYRLHVVNSAGCEDTAPLLLVVDKRFDIYIPNIFSPDDDGENDVFMIFADPKSVVKIKSFQIFSRWGELVCEYYNFEPNNPAFGWNGKYRGQDLNPAVFVWYAVIELVDGQEVLFEGDVTLKR